MQRAERPGAKPPHPATVQRRAAGPRAPQGRVGQPATLVDPFVFQPPTFEPLDIGPSPGPFSLVDMSRVDRRESFKQTTKPEESRRKRREQQSKISRTKREELVNLSRFDQLERTDVEEDVYEPPVQASYSAGTDGLFEGQGFRKDGTAIVIRGSSVAGVRYEAVVATGPMRWRRVPYSGPDGNQ